MDPKNAPHDHLNGAHTEHDTNDHHEGSTLLDNAKVAVQYKVYHRRWLMLILFSILSLSNATCWITYSPIAILSMNYYNVSEFGINTLSMIYMWIYIPFVWVASYIIDRLGLRVGIIVGCVLNASGAWVRYVGGDGTTGFAVAFVGQTLLSLAQTFILGIPPQVAGNWFPEHQRATATSIAALFNQLGIALGFIIAAPIVSNQNDIPKLLLLEAIMCSVIAVVVVVLFRGNPPTPPSHSAGTKKEPFLPAMKAIMTQRSFLILLFNFGVIVGSFYAVSTLMNLIVQPAGYTDDDTGMFGYLIVLVGVVGAFLAGVLGDKYKKLKLLTLITYFGTFFSLLGFTLAVVPNQKHLIALCCSLMGFFMTAVLPVCFELAVECTYPVSEAVSGGAILMSANTFGFLFIVVMGEMAKLFDGPKKYNIANWFLVAVVGVACLSMLFFKEENKRMAGESTAKQETHDDHSCVSMQGSVSQALK